MKKHLKYYLFIAVALSLVMISHQLMADNGNTKNDSFIQSKKWLEKDVYYDHRTTLYCQAEFNQDKKIKLSTGFTTDKYKSRSERVEWEHVVPAENFGRTFPEWRDGSPLCQDKNGNSFKGRKCAETANREYRYMQADMYNLYPAIGSVNAARQNYNFTQFESHTPSSFGACPMKIQEGKAEPPPAARGTIARTYLYFERAYRRYHMSESQRHLMHAWDKQYPVDSWECERACRIQKIQGNINPVVKDRCIKDNLWACP